MCGIAGLLTPTPHNSETLTATVVAMSTALKARGPDDAGSWVDVDAGIALGHRRLAVVDLTSEGHQPKVSACGRYVLSFNGEIYNFRALRRELEGLGHAFRGQSDTEVILGALSQWGLADAVTRLNGMFAMGVWDKTRRALTLVRDRLGEKPLYYGWLGDTVVFASDLRAIERHPGFRAKINTEAVSLYLRLGHVPAPHSIYEGLFKLPPGCLLTLDIGDADRKSSFSPDAARDAGAAFSPVQYWSAYDVARHGIEHPFRGTAAEAAESVELLLADSVGLRMVADVPLGVLLSGGVDSSLIASLMQARSRVPIRTFTIGFADKRFNEAEHAASVARHLGTDHTELYLDAPEALGVIERLPAIYDEPFADASQIPTTILSALVRKHVTVALSGDGGDELFGGYTRYSFGQSIWGRVARVPWPLRRAAGSLLRMPSSQQWDGLSRRLSFLHSHYGVNGTAGDKFHKLADVLSMPDGDAFYERLITVWTDPDAILVAPGSVRLADVENPAPVRDIASRMMYRDLVGYLPDDILTKVDRASMSVSLEMRVPLLDHRLVEFAWTLPTDMKIRAGRSKQVLRSILDRYVPRELIDRPKMGFGVPVGAWLRGPLRPWAESLLDEKKLRADELLDYRVIRRRWEEHLSGRRDWTGPIWSILMLQDWRRYRKVGG